MPYLTPLPAPLGASTGPCTSSSLFISFIKAVEFFDVLCRKENIVDFVGACSFSTQWLVMLRVLSSSLYFEAF